MKKEIFFFIKKNPYYKKLYYILFKFRISKMCVFIIDYPHMDNYAHFWRDYIFRSLMYNKNKKIKITPKLYNKHKIALENLNIKFKIQKFINKTDWDTYIKKNGGYYLDTCNFKCSLYPYLISKEIDNYKKYNICYITRGNNKRRNILNEKQLLKKIQELGIEILEPTYISEIDQM